MRVGDFCILKSLEDDRKRVSEVTGIRARGSAVVACRLLRYWDPRETFIGSFGSDGFDGKELFKGTDDDERATIEVAPDEIAGRCWVKRFASLEGDEARDWVGFDDRHFWFRFCFSNASFVYSEPADARQQTHTFPPRILDLFAGCGGLSAGFEMAGMPIKFAIEK